MPTSIVIPPNFWSKDVTVIFTLTDQHRRPFPAEITDASGWVAGAQAFVIGVDGATINIPCNDELPSPPGESPPVGSFWLISVDDNYHRPIYHVQISSASPPTNWNELIEASTPVDPADIWSGRLGPADAIAGQYQQFDGLTWQAVDPPAGTGDVIGPAGATDGNLAVFDGPTGKILKDGGPPGSGGGIPEAPEDGQIYGRKDAAWSQVTPTEIAAVPESRRVDGAQSITGGGVLTSDLSLSLSGDLASPGNNKLYGTDGAGTRGWYDQPTGGAAVWGAITGTLSDQTDLQSELDAKTNTSLTLTAGAGLSGGGNLVADRSFAVNVQYSVTIDVDTLQLVGDMASPGANKLYGTDGAGIKGWYNQPSGGAGSTDLGNIPSTTNVEITSSSGADTTIAAATISLAGVMSAVQVASLQGKEDAANLKQGAYRDVGTGAGDLAAGNAPAAAVSGHDGDGGAHSGVLPTSDQKAALDANPSLTGLNAVASIADLPAGTDLGNVPAVDSVQITSSTGANTTIAVAGANAGVMSAAQVTSLAGKMDISVYDPTTIAANAFDRANHTGNQPLATISDAGTAAAQDVGVLIGNIPQLVDAGGATPGLPAVSGALLTEILIKAIYDPGNVNDDAFARANHTGQQTLSTISDAGTAAARAIGLALTNVPELIDVGGGTPGFGVIDGRNLTNLPGGGGWVDGSDVNYWNTPDQDLGNVSGTAAADIDNGPVIRAAQTGPTTFTFSTGSGMTNMPFTLILASGGFSPNFLFTGATVRDPDGVNWSTDGDYWVTFQKVGAVVYYMQGLMQ